MINKLDAADANADFILKLIDYSGLRGLKLLLKVSELDTNFETEFHAALVAQFLSGNYHQI